MEAILRKAAMHGDIILMGINPQIVAIGHSKIEALGSNSSATLSYRNSVDNPIWRIIQPGAINMAVCGIFL